MSSEQQPVAADGDSVQQQQQHREGAGMPHSEAAVGEAAPGETTDAGAHEPFAYKRQRRGVRDSSALAGGAAESAAEHAASAGQAAGGPGSPPHGGSAPQENGRLPSGRKRKKPDYLADDQPDPAAVAAAAFAAATANEQHAADGPPRPIDVGPFVEMARKCETQEELRQKLMERFPAMRGRSAVNREVRDLFATLCPGQVFHKRESAMPHLSHQLFVLAGKPVGKPPAHYKPRGPRSPALSGAAPVPAAAAAGEVPPPPADDAAPQRPAPAPAGVIHTAPGPLGPAAGLAAEAAARRSSAAPQAGGDMLPSGPAAAASARAAATAAGEALTLAGLDASAAMQALLAEYPPEMVRIAALVRRTLNLQKGEKVQLRLMLKTGLLGGQDVRFQTKAGRVQNSGRLGAGGSITCFCKACGAGGREVSASEFEEHSGSKDRRPADGIFLESCNRSLKDLLTLVNSPEMAACTREVDVHMEVCQQCKLGGELLCCDGCTAAYHLACVNLDAAPPADCFCPLCVAAGITSRPEPLPLQPKQVSAVMARSGKGRPSSGGVKAPGSSGKLSKQARPSEGGGGGAAAAAAGPPRTGRVHMAAPMAPRAPRIGRPGAGRANKNKRLFEGEDGALVDGQKLFYRTTQGETLLTGEARIVLGGPSGIFCHCCNTVISASGFEAHAGRGQRRAPYDNIFTEEGITLKAMAALLPDRDEEGEAGRRGGGGGEYGLDDAADDAREVVSELDTLAGGCVLCHEVDFQRGGFGPRTIMLCDQCEREFHVGCLSKCGVADLDAVPEGDWYCSEECERIRSNVNSVIAQQQMDISGYPSHTWQVMRGRDGRPATSQALRFAQEILQESFDPIMDLGSNTDLLPVMLYARRVGEWDYSNCLTLLLRHKGKPVVAAICRIFGPQMAELPLVATRNTARRQGHARILVNCFEELLRQSGVRTLALPAAHETVETWKSGFNFEDMPEDDVRLAKQQLRILIFPGTEVLWKQFPEVPPPQGHHVLVPPPPRPSDEEAADAMEVAGITANMVACVAAACGEPVLPHTLGMTAEQVVAAAPPMAAPPPQHAQAAPAQAPPAGQLDMQPPQEVEPGQQQQGDQQQRERQQQQQQQPATDEQQQQQNPGKAEPGKGGPALMPATAPPEPQPAPDDYEAAIAAAINAGAEAAALQLGAVTLAEAPPMSAAGALAAAAVRQGVAPMDVDACVGSLAGAQQEVLEAAVGPAEDMRASLPGSQLDTGLCAAAKEAAEPSQPAAQQPASAEAMSEQAVPAAAQTLLTDEELRDPATAGADRPAAPGVPDGGDGGPLLPEPLAALLRQD